MKPKGIKSLNIPADTHGRIKRYGVEIGMDMGDLIAIAWDSYEAAHPLDESPSGSSPTEKKSKELTNAETGQSINVLDSAVIRDTLHTTGKTTGQHGRFTEEHSMLQKILESPSAVRRRAIRANLEEFSRETDAENLYGEIAAKLDDLTRKVSGFDEKFERLERGGREDRTEVSEPRREPETRGPSSKNKRGA